MYKVKYSQRCGSRCSATGTYVVVVVVLISGCTPVRICLALPCNKTQLYSCNNLKYSDRQVWANSVDPDQTAPGTVRQSVCIFWMHYSMVLIEPCHKKTCLQGFRPGKNS